MVIRNFQPVDGWIFGPIHIQLTINTQSQTQFISDKWPLFNDCDSVSVFTIPGRVQTPGNSGVESAHRIFRLHTYKYMMYRLITQFRYRKEMYDYIILIIL